MRTRSRKAGRPRVEELDVGGLARVGGPPDDWPRILAAVLVMDACDGERVDVALPGEQAEAVAAEIVALVDQARSTARVWVRPHRLGWRRVTVELIDSGPVPLTD